MHRRGQGQQPPTAEAREERGGPQAGAALWARSEQPLQGREVPDAQQGCRGPSREGNGGKQLTGGLSRSRGRRGAIAPIFIFWDFLHGCLSLPGSGSQTWLSPPEPGRTEDCPEPAHPRRGFSHSPEWHRGQNLGLALISGGAGGGGIWRAGGRRTLMQHRRRYDWASGPAASESVIGLSCLLAQVPELRKG